MKISSKKIRSDFISFFENKKHKFVRSSPVLPINDPTLLFTNAGMNQFKDIFLGLKTANNKRAVNSQKCIRVSGKHNDLEEVGIDNYHHTLFEMLGNWSFGDYYKKEAIIWSWELLTELWKLDKNRLWVTVYKDDDEAELLWKEFTDVPHDRILRFGNKDNFWEMGETGPCGPCSEIHYYTGNDISKQKKEGVNSKEEYRELWNLVFIQFNRNSKGKLEELTSKYVDTGLGLERIVATLNKEVDHYKTDLFLPIIDEIIKMSGKSYDFQDGIPHRVIADHLRMVSFSLTDGIMPSNEGRGYVVRRVLRRACRFGRVLDIKNEFIYKLVDVLIEILAEAYPELKEKENHIKSVIEAEEKAFGITLDRGLKLFNDLCNNLKDKIISGEDAFKLYDTFGFPLDLTQLLAKEKKLTVDLKTFDKLMLNQRETARKQNKFQIDDDDNKWIEFDKNISESIFLGYEQNDIESNIVKYRKNDKYIELILDKTSFYAESGGQVGDAGKIENKDFCFIVHDTYYLGEFICHKGFIKKGDIKLQKNISVYSKYDKEKRRNIRLNHTATHLLHKALKEILGEHVQQAGSLVADDRLRFDLTHYQKISENEIDSIESLVNSQISNNIKLNTELKNYDQAKKEGAEALFGEKYEDEVRVVNVDGFSKELCGGTHVNRTGDILVFKIVSETSLAAGIRRIEAITGEEALIYLNKQNKIVSNLKINLQCKEDEILDKVYSYQDKIKILNEKLEESDNIKVESLIDDIFNEKLEKLKGIKFLTQKINLDINPKSLADISRRKFGSKGVGFFGISKGNKNIFLCVVTKDISEEINAGSIVKNVAEELGGKGGGSPSFAVTSFENAAMLGNALKIAVNKLKEII